MPYNKTSFLRPTTFILLAALFILPACGQTAAPSPAVIASLEPTAADSPSPSTSTPDPAPALTPSPVEKLIPSQTFDDASPAFCQTKVNLAKTGGMTFSCADGKFTFLTDVDARDSNRYLDVSLPIKTAESFTLEADLTSQGAPGKADQNSYGFIFRLDETHSYSLHFKGAYYRFEKNILKRNYLKEDLEIHVNRNWNWNYSAAFKGAGSSNHIQLTCRAQTCDLLLNRQHAARFNLDQPLAVSSLSLFAEAAINQPFGSVAVDDLHLYLPTAANPAETQLQINDALLGSPGSFSVSGLSGAFSRFQADGFHFSPIVPFGYYGVKSDPAMGDVSVSATLRLKADSPNSSMYGGLVCRSSLDGMYFAAIRENGYFSVFRDSPTRPFSLLAEAKSTAILTGGEPNQLRLDCIGSAISFTINGSRVASLQDNTFQLVFGRTGFFTKAGKNPDVDSIVFSNLEIREIR
jgi:hypothetical protein